MVIDDIVARVIDKIGTLQRSPSSTSRTTAPFSTVVIKPRGTHRLVVEGKQKATGTPKTGTYIVLHKNEDGTISFGNQKTLHQGSFYGIGAPTIVEHRLPPSAIPTLRAALAHKAKRE